MSVHAQSSAVRINEFMALNSTTLQDSDGVYSDWIEIYNSSASAVNLLNWSLTDDSTDIAKWKFPAVSLPANSFLLVFASGKDISIAGRQLHTNFKLSGSGEFLGLFDADGNAVSVFDPAFPEQKTDIAFAYDGSNYVFTAMPTPGTTNVFPTNQVLPAPRFNMKHGFYEAPFSVTITSDFPSAKIFYTTDGSTPSDSSGTLYSTPISITTTTLLRAVAVETGLQPSATTTATYLFLNDVIRQPNNPPGYPAEWGPYIDIPDTAIADYEMDPEITQNPSYSGLMIESLLSIPTMSIVTNKEYLFSRIPDSVSGGIYIYTGAPGVNEVPVTGNDWERPASVEFFDRDGSKEFQVNCGLKIHGGHSRRAEKSPKHSFRIVFRDIYGTTKLNYPLFGSDATTTFNSLVLRATYGNTWLHMNHSERKHAQLIHDVWAKDTQLDMGHPSGHGNFVHLYINGLYWGVYNPTERIDSDYGETYIGGLGSDYDVIKDYDEIVDGDIKAWNATFTLARSGLANDATYQRIQGKNPDGTDNPAYQAYVDVENLIDYMIMNFYGANWDWDHHNWIAVRNRVNPRKGFQFFSWDAEHILEDLTSNVLAENNSKMPSELFRLFLQNAQFKKLFADRAQKHCFHGGALTPEIAGARWMKRSEEIDTAIIAESARWGDYRRDVHRFTSAGPFYLYDPQWWLNEQSFLLNAYFPNRTAEFINQLKTASLFPSTSAPQVLVNGVPFTQNSVNAGDTITMSFSGGTVYYTVDGSDPELLGQPSPVAVAYTAPVILSHSARFKIRRFYRDIWSPLVDIKFFIPSEMHQLKLTELHYHPLVPDTLDNSDFEFIELKNTGQALDISGVRFTEGISYTFPQNTTLDAGGFVVLASDKESFRSRYGFSPFGEYTGALDNGGERLVALSAQSDTLVSVTYADDSPWPGEADGGGSSLVSREIDPTGNPNDPSYWRLSYKLHGSPGSDDVVTQIADAQTSLIPAEFVLHQNFPNPFNSTTVIGYSVPSLMGRDLVSTAGRNGQLTTASKISLKVYNLLGQEVATLFEGIRQPGEYVVTFDGSKLASGVYLYKLTADSFVETKKLLLIR